MVDRPFSERRPVGPFVDLEEIGPFETLGVSGIASPGDKKAELVAVYALDTHVATLPRDLDSIEGTLQEKIRDRLGKVRVKAKRSGSTSSAPFDSQAVIVQIPPEELPVQDNQLHKIQGVIERHYEFTDVGVQAMFLDTGK